MVGAGRNDGRHDDGGMRKTPAYRVQQVSPHALGDHCALARIDSHMHNHNLHITVDLGLLQPHQQVRRRQPRDTEVLHVGGAIKELLALHTPENRVPKQQVGGGGMHTQLQKLVTGGGSVLMWLQLTVMTIVLVRLLWGWKAADIKYSVAASSAVFAVGGQVLQHRESVAGRHAGCLSISAGCDRR